MIRPFFRLMGGCIVMRHGAQPVLTVALVIVVGACLALNIWIRLPNRTGESTTPSPGDPDPLIGVILAGAASDYGWRDLTRSDSRFATSSLDGYPLLIFEGYLAARSPDLTLEHVIADMHARGASVIFVSTGLPFTLEEAAHFAQVTTAALIFNRADRATVAAMLPALIPERPAPPVIASTTMPDDPSPEEQDEPKGAVIALLALLIITGLFVRNGWTTLRNRVRQRRDLH